MTNIHKLKFSLNKLIDYFVIISFLFPRGYAEFNLLYKNIFTCCIWMAIIIIWVQFFFFYFRGMIKKETLPIISYFVITIIITFLIRGFVINGYQKLIAYPSICLFIVCNLRKNPKRFLNTINNVILILFILNQVILRDFFEQQYHMTFLGHVQMISQIGSLSIFCAMIFWIMYHENKKRTVLIILLVLYTMITTDASSSMITAIILCIFLFLYKIGKYSILTHNSKNYIIIGMILNVIIVSLSVINNLKYSNEIYFLDFSGRSFVWIDALSKIKSKLIFGYGIDGVLLDVFWNKWTNSEGFNYAHNQILQNLLDGGLIGFILFEIMIFSCFRNTRNISNERCKALINIILIIFSVIMIFESTSLYCYMFMYLSIIYALPDVIDKIEKGEDIDGSYQ